ncbi:MAG: M24 family metallopeptidase [Deferrisomatales bacterium]
MHSVPERLAALRRALDRHGLTHYLVPSTDEHLNEYVPAWGQRRTWLSGFTGSAGDLLVGRVPEETRLFTDGRYHLQAEEELAGSGIALEKVGAPGGRTLREALAELARRHGKACAVGCDPKVLGAETFASLEKALRAGGAALKRVEPNLVDELWHTRPSPPKAPLYRCPPEWTGRSAEEKVAELLSALERPGADALAAVRLDQIAWLTNLRGEGDVPFSPVFEAFAFIDADGVQLFLRAPETRLPGRVGGLRVHDYGEFLPFLRRRARGRVLVDPKATTQAVVDALTDNPSTQAVSAANPVDELKAVKNPAEQLAMARAGLGASAALTRALLWLEDRLRAGTRITERAFRGRLESFYAQAEGFRGLSFPTIAATGAHGAIVHYAGADDTELRPGELFLVDSGIHAAGGTSDITRTVIVGAPTEEQRRVYTRVLQGHLAAARLVFPAGTPGAALDAIARAPLWAERLHYEHGTGHGVGAFLNVHEGPFTLAEARGRPQAAYGLRAGMITSVEPGYYRANFGGVRLENLYLLSDAGESEDGRRWLGLTPLTWVPFDRRLIDRERLCPAERGWLDDYHRECLERLSPLLSAEERARLAESLEG